MALVTIVRSPSSSNSTDAVSICLQDEDSVVVDGAGQVDSPESQKCASRNRSGSECYFVVKGTAIILPQNDCVRVPKSHSSADGEIQEHLKSMLDLLRPLDQIKMAVQLQSSLRNYTRYMTVVSSPGRQDPESAILGIDVDTRTGKASFGLALPIWSNMILHVDGDTGITVFTGSEYSVFKPSSVQGIWFLIQCLYRELSFARAKNYYEGGLSHTWVQYYDRNHKSPACCISEWIRTYNGESEFGAGTADRFRLEGSADQARTIKLISDKLREIMQSVDLSDVTTADIRLRLEKECPSCSLSDFKDFISNEIIVILGQMEEMSLIDANLYLGTEFNAYDIVELKAKNIKFILNVTKEVDNFYPVEFVYKNVRVSDDSTTELLKHWNDCYEFIAKAINSNLGILVHCKKGISRSSSTVIAYLMKAKGWTLQEAMRVVKEKRECVRPNEGFLKQLVAYEGILTASQNRNLLQRILPQRLCPKPSPRTRNEQDLKPWDGLRDDDDDDDQEDVDLRLTTATQTDADDPSCQPGPTIIMVADEQCSTSAMPDRSSDLIRCFHLSPAEVAAELSKSPDHGLEKALGCCGDTPTGSKLIPVAPDNDGNFDDDIDLFQMHRLSIKRHQVAMIQRYENCPLKDVKEKVSSCLSRPAVGCGSDSGGSLGSITGSSSGDDCDQTLAGNRRHFGAKAGFELQRRHSLGSSGESTGDSAVAELAASPPRCCGIPDAKDVKCCVMPTPATIPASHDRSTFKSWLGGAVTPGTVRETVKNWPTSTQNKDELRCVLPEVTKKLTKEEQRKLKLDKSSSSTGTRRSTLEKFRQSWPFKRNAARDPPHATSGTLVPCPAPKPVGSRWRQAIPQQRTPPDVISSTLSGKVKQEKDKLEKLNLRDRQRFDELVGQQKCTRSVLLRHPPTVRSMIDLEGGERQSQVRRITSFLEHGACDKIRPRSPRYSDQSGCQRKGQPGGQTVRSLVKSFELSRSFDSSTQGPRFTQSAEACNLPNSISTKPNHSSAVLFRCGYEEFEPRPRGGSFSETRTPSLSQGVSLDEERFSRTPSVRSAVECWPGLTLYH